MNKILASEGRTWPLLVSLVGLGLLLVLGGIALWGRSAAAGPDPSAGGPLPDRAAAASDLAWSEPITAGQVITFYLPLLGRDWPYFAPFATAFQHEFYTYGNAIQQTGDGGYIVAGRTGSPGIDYGTDAWLLKLNGDSSIAWQKRYGGWDWDEARAVDQAVDGGYVVAGSNPSFGAGHFDAWVFKVALDGSPVWQKVLGGPQSDVAYAIRQAIGGGYVVAGHTESLGSGGFDALVFKLAVDGGVVWQRTYGGAGSDRARDIWRTVDGGYVVAGETASFGAGNADAWLLKLDDDGNVLWQVAYGGADRDAFFAVQQVDDGGYVAAGTTSSFGTGDQSMWVLRLDAGGGVIWQKTYGGTDWDSASSIRQTRDGGYVVAGSTSSFGVDVVDIIDAIDAWLLKLDGLGNVSWQKTYGGLDQDEAAAVQQINDGRYLVTGKKHGGHGMGNYKLWVLKVDTDGSFCAGCSLGQDSDALPLDSNAAVTKTTVVALDVELAVLDVVPTAYDTDALVDTICVCPAAGCE